MGLDGGLDLGVDWVRKRVGVVVGKIGGLIVELFESYC